MKQFGYLAIIAALMLTGCGDTNTQKIDDLIAAQAQADDPSSEQTASAAPLNPSDDAADGQYDVDLTALDSNMVYAQVNDMVNGDTDYSGKTVRAKGTFDYYLDPDTKKEYFAVLIADAAACCAQGIEFELAGEHKYPEDYPELGSEIVVHGIFNTYEDDYGTFVQLKDAVIE